MIRLAFTGDILSYRIQNQLLKKKYGYYNYETVFEKIAKKLKNSDYVVGSLETPVAKKLKYTNSPINFNTPEEIIPALKKTGFDMLTTANNHCLDRGIEGLVSTIHALNKYDIDFTGTRLKKEDKNYLVKNIKGVKIAFIAYTYGTNSLSNEKILNNDEIYMCNLTRKQERPPYRSWEKRMAIKVFNNFLPSTIKEKIRPSYNNTIIKDCVNPNEINSIDNMMYIDDMKKTIEEAKCNADITVFCLHSGGQFNSEVGDYTNFLVNEITASGVDLLICNHTHSILPIKYVNNCLVAYSLGNFSFTPGYGYYIPNVYADYSIILYVDIEEKSKRFYPSFSILKNIIDKDRISRIYPIYETYLDIHKNKNKTISKDINKIYELVTTKRTENLKNKSEYLLV